MVAIFVLPLRPLLGAKLKTELDFRIAPLIDLISAIDCPYRFLCAQTRTTELDQFDCDQSNHCELPSARSRNYRPSPHSLSITPAIGHSCQLKISPMR